MTAAAAANFCGFKPQWVIAVHGVAASETSDGVISGVVA
jgi:hypothetical protein